MGACDVIESITSSKDGRIHDVTSAKEHIAVSRDVKNSTTSLTDKINISIDAEKTSNAIDINHVTNTDSHLKNTSDDVTERAETVVKRPLAYHVATQQVALSSNTSQQRVTVNDVTTRSTSRDTASCANTAASNVARPCRRERRSGLQFVQRPKQVVLVELSASSNTAPTTNKSRATADEIISDISMTSPRSPSDDQRYKSSTGRMSSSEDINDNVDSSTLMRLRANLKTSQVRQASVSTRFTANGTELPRSIDSQQ